MRRALTWMAAALLAGGAGAAEAQSGRPSATGAPAAELVRQKQAFAGRLLADVPALERISASGDPESARLVEQAREKSERARRALEAGDHTSANALLNEAIAALGQARRLAPDAGSRSSGQQARHAQLLASLESLRVSYREHLSHLGRDDKDDPASLAVGRHLERARVLAAQGALGDANRALLQAENAQLDAFGPLLSGKTIDYTPHFRDPADEYRFELERNRSYAELVPLALLELRPADAARQLVARYVESSQTLRGAAKRQAAERDFERALASLRAGTAYLQRALLAAGLAVPQEIKE